MAKKKVTKADLDKTLREFGFREGDEIFLPSQKNKSNEQSETNEEEDDDTGGSQPPPGKERP